MKNQTSKRAWYERWWVWVIAGVFVLGGIGTLLEDDNENSTGEFAPIEPLSTLSPTPTKTPDETLSLNDPSPLPPPDQPQESNNPPNGYVFDTATGEWIYIPPPPDLSTIEVDETTTPDAIYGFRNVAVKIQLEHIAIGRNVYTEIGNVEGEPGIKPQFRIIDIDISSGQILAKRYKLEFNPMRYELTDMEEWLDIESVITPTRILTTYYVLK
jgi:hypothetical protein